MSKLLLIDDIPAFREIRQIPPEEIGEDLRSAVRGLHEVDEMEEFLRAIFHDRAATPHGPAELVDILTHKIALPDSTGLGAFVLKGRSYPTVRPKDISHQIYRLENISGLHWAVLGTTGVVLDAVKEQFSSTCLRLGIDFSIFDVDDFARLFSAYGFLCPRDGTQIRGGRCHCGYAPAKAHLNLLQEDALRALSEDRGIGHSRGLIVLPTGAGKTRVAALDSKASGAASVLYIAQSHEILEVAESEFAAAFGAADVTTFGSKRELSTVNLATIQYLNKHRAALKGLKLDYVIIDEFHHAAAPTYRSTLSSIEADYVLGMTATPFRSDNKDIVDICNGNIVVSYDLRSGIDTGILTPYHYFGCFDEADYSDIPDSNVGYSVSDLEKTLFIPERHQAIVQKWREKSNLKPTIAFCYSHEHAERVANAFSAGGVPAAVYLGSTPSDVRRKLTSDLRLSKLKVLCVVDVLNEGADMPFVECLLFLRPTESKRVFIQQLGRGLRKYLGKSHCTVIDFIGNFRNAYRIIEYHDLRTDEVVVSANSNSRTVKDILDLPLNCEVTFEDRVLDIFADQTLNPEHATRSNISRILIHRYIRLCKRLGRPANARDVDRNEILDSSFYKRVFKSWRKFTELIQSSYPGQGD